MKQQLLLWPCLTFLPLFRPPHHLVATAAAASITSRPRPSLFVTASSAVSSSLLSIGKMQPHQEDSKGCSLSSSSALPPVDSASPHTSHGTCKIVDELDGQGPHVESAPNLAETSETCSAQESPPAQQSCSGDEEASVSNSGSESEAISSEQPNLVVRAQSQRQKMGGDWFELTESCFLVLHRGDITKWFVDGESDAIVNAANERMLGGGGVDGAIHRAAGPELYEECLKLPLKSRGVRCRTGDAVITKGFDLPASRIIHTVGPIYEDERSAIWLQKAYKSSLNLATENGIKYLAFPAISCGVYGYPYDEAAEVALRTVEDSASGLEEVHFVLFETGSWEAWLSMASRFKKL